MEKVRFGIVGCGNMGTSHAKHLLEGKITKAEEDCKKYTEEIIEYEENEK